MWFLKLARRSRGVDERSEERGVAHHGWATPRRFWPLGGVKTRFLEEGQEEVLGYTADAAEMFGWA